MEEEAVGMSFTRRFIGVLRVMIVSGFGEIGC